MTAMDLVLIVVGLAGLVGMFALGPRARDERPVLMTTCFLVFIGALIALMAS